MTPVNLYSKNKEKEKNICALLAEDDNSNGTNRSACGSRPCMENEQRDESEGNATATRCFTGHFILLMHTNMEVFSITRNTTKVQ